MAGYLGAIPVPQATQNRESFTALANQTSFATAGYTVGFVDAFLNGVRLNTADITASNGSDIVLASGAAVNDILDVISYATFEINAQTFTGTTTLTDVVATSLDISGNIDIDGITNLDVVDIDGAVNMATTLLVTGNVDFNGDLDVDGTTNLDVVDIDGAVNIATTALVTGVLTTTAATVFNGGFASNAASSINSTTNTPVIIKSTASTGGYAELQVGANGATIGYLGSGESLVSGAAADLTLRAQANLLFGSGGGSERMRLSNLGQVNIRKGSAAIVTPLQFDGLVIQNTDATGIRIISDQGNSNVGHAGIGVDNGALTISAKGQISFDTGFLPSDQLYTGRVERFNIASGGDVTVKTGDLIFGTAGKGVVLGATTNVAANTLDDYEFGTWTPSPATTSGSVTVASGAIGKYVKVGKQVTLFFQFVISNTGNGSGALYVNGKPFAQHNNQYYPGTVRVRSNATGNGVSELDSGDGLIYLYGSAIHVSTYHGSITYMTA